jgi:hypothetical protein
VTPEKEEFYSGVVGKDIVRPGFVLEGLRNLDCAVGDIGNAFLCGKTREKVYIIASSEFGDKLKGKRLVVYMVLQHRPPGTMMCCQQNSDQ